MYKEKYKELENMKTLSDEISAIMDNAIKEILDRTDGHKSAREYLIQGVCNSCILVLTSTKYKKDEKIASFKRQADHYVSDIDKAIEDFSSCIMKQ